MNLSLIQMCIDSKIKQYTNEKALLDAEIIVLKDKLCSHSNSIFKTTNIYLAKLNTVESLVLYIENEIILLKKAFDQDMVDNLDYTLQNNKSFFPKLVANTIIDARKEIFRFSTSKLNSKHYEKQTKNLIHSKHILNEFSLIKISLDIPKKPYDILKNLIFWLYSAQFKSNDAIQEIITIISDAKIMPRNFQKYNEEFFFQLYRMTKNEMLKDLFEKHNISSPEERLKLTDFI